jgi:spore coat protein U-like protein
MRSRSFPGSGALRIVAVALLLVACGPHRASAETSTSTTATLNVGPSVDSAFAVSVTGANFSAVTYRPGSGYQNATGSIVITVTDTRSGAPGWTVTMAASGDLRSGASSIPIGNLSFRQGTIQGRDGASTNGVSRSGITMSTQPQRILSVQSRAGTGTFDYTMPGTIRVPDGAVAGTYTTTLTVTLTSGS